MDSTQRRNAFLNAAGEAVFGFKTNLVASVTVLTVLLRQYGASERMVGAVWSIETAGALLPQLLGLYLFPSYSRRRRDLILWHIVVMLPVLLAMAGLTFEAKRLDPVLYRWGMLLCHAYYWFCIGAVNAAWGDFLAALFPVSIRGTAMGVAMGAASLAGAAGALTAGRLIRVFPAPGVFGWLYAAAWFLGTLSLCLWIPVDDRALRAMRDPPRPAFRQLVGHFARSLSDANFRAFLTTRVLSTLGFCTAPFIAVRYMAPGFGGLAGGTVVSCGAAMTLGFCLASLALGPLGDRRGHRLGVLAGIAMQVATLAVLLMVPGLPGCILAYAGTGVCNACAAVAGSNMIYETCPHEHRMAHISVGNLLIGTPMAFAAVLAGMLAEKTSLTVVFLLCLGFSLAALAWCALRVREPRTLPARQA